MFALSLVVATNRRWRRWGVRESLRSFKQMRRGSFARWKRRWRCWAKRRSVRARASTTVSVKLTRHHKLIQRLQTLGLIWSRPRKLIQREAMWPEGVHRHRHQAMWPEGVHRHRHHQVHRLAMWPKGVHRHRHLQVHLATTPYGNHQVHRVIGRGAITRDQSSTACRGRPSRALAGT